MGCIKVVSFITSIFEREFKEKTRLRTNSFNAMGYHLLEILKFTLPALIVFLTAYFVLKQYLDRQYQLRALELKTDQQKTTLPLRLQAYERLALLCERTAIPNLLVRLRTDSGTAAGLRLSMLIAIQQEFDHNVSQQVYISDKLWSILKAARTETENIIAGVAEQVDSKGPAEAYAQLMLKYLSTLELSPTDQALLAIRKEAGLLM